MLLHLCLNQSKLFTVSVQAGVHVCRWYECCWLRGRPAQAVNDMAVDDGHNHPYQDEALFSHVGIAGGGRPMETSSRVTISFPLVERALGVCLSDADDRQTLGDCSQFAQTPQQ